MRGGGGFLALGFGGFPLFLAGLRGVLPQIAGDEGFFPGADALVQAVPLGDGVQFVGGKNGFHVGDGGGLLVAVLVDGDRLCSDGGDLFRGVVCGGDGVQGGGGQLCGFVLDDLIIAHAFHGTCSFSCCGWCSG